MAGQATLSITLNGEIDDSNYGGNSFLVTNVGDKKITKVELDVTDALFPDTVFDPFGEAGDTISKILRINTSGSTGVVAPDAASYIGAGGIAGFEKIQILFDSNSSGGFQPGETLGFSIDMDPNSIAGADKFPLDSGSSPHWDVGGVSGAELIGSTFTVTFEDGATASGQLQGVLDSASSNSQGGARALATENPSAGSVTLSVDGLGAGGVGSYGAGGPQVLVSGPAGETALVVLAKGFIQPVTNPFDEPYKSQLDAQLAELAGTPFPANNAVEMQVREVLLTGSLQDITSLFDFTGVPIAGVADADQLPLAFVAGLVDPANGHLPIGPVSTPIYLTAGTGGLSAVDDTAQSAGAAVEIDVLANDSDDDGGTLGLVSFTQGAQGTVTRNSNGTPGDISDDTLVYTPGGSGGFTGDSFTYQVGDGQGNFETATVTVVSTASGVPAVTVNAGLDVSEGASAAIGRGLLATTDADTQAANLTYTVTALPANGTLTLNGAALGVGDSFTQANVDANALGYTHNGSETAADSFGFEVTDGATTIEGQSFAIDVAPVNDAPVGTSDSYSANAGVPLSVGAASGVLDNDSDAENDVLDVAAVNGSITDIGNAITLPSGATLTLNADGSFQYLPAAGFSGPDSFTYAPGDGSKIGDPVTVSLDVAGGTPAGGFSLNINAGGGAYTAADGTEFIADTYFSGGIVKTYSSSIAGTEDDTLYQSERTDYSFSYAVPVANGTYAVTLDFAETFVGSAGRRVFDVEIEDGLVIDNLDIFAAAGGKNIAYSSGVITVEVTDGVLDIEFLKEVQKPAINAIRITALEVQGQAPVAVDDSYATDEDTPLTVAAAGVLANDDDANGDPLAAVVTSGPSNGTLALSPNGSFVYTPNANFAGTDSFTYAVSDGNGNSDEATATIAVAAVNDAPDGAADAYATLTGTALSIGAAEGLLANDSDVEGDAVAVAAVEGSAGNGGAEVALDSGATVTVNADGSFDYTPRAGFSGADSFTYAPGDGEAAGDPVTVTIEVSGGGAPEVTTNLGLTLDEGTTTGIGAALLATTDTNTPAADLVYTLTSVPANGTLSLDGTALGAGSSFTQADVDSGLLGYAHDGSETTADDFGFDVTDGIFTVESQSFAIEVAPVNDVPVGTPDDGYEVAAGTAFLVDAANGVLANDTDADDATLVVAAVEGNAASVGTEITLASGALLTLNPNGSFSYTPAAGFSGTDSFTYTPGDGTGTGAPVTVSLGVAGGGGGPVAGDFELYINAGGGAYTSTDGNDYVADSFFAGGRTYSKNVTVNGTDEPELFQTERYGTFDYIVPVENGTYAVSLDFAEIYFNAAGQRVFDVEIEDKLVVDNLDIFAAAGGKNITYSTGPITVEVSDGALNIEFLKGIQNPKINAISVIRLAVDGAAPLAVADSYVATEDTVRTVSAAFGVLNNDSDADGNPLTASLVSGPSNGTLLLNADGSFEYTPDAEFSGADSFTYAASDGTGNSTEATATITVAAVNDAPEGAADAYATPTGSPLAVTGAAGLLANDADIEGDALVVAAVQGSASNVGATITLASGATLTVNADGSFDYTPAAGFSGTDSFTYAPGDGTDAGSPVTVTIDVAGGGGAPEVTTNAGLSLDEGATAAIGAGILATTDSDTPAADLVYTLTSAPANGTLSLGGTALGLGASFTQADVDAGLLGYAHDGSETTTDGFGFDVTDGDFPVVGQTFEITVDPVNDAPVGTADGGYQVALDTAFSIGAANGLLANDTDAEGGPLAVASVQGSTANVGTAITLDSGATLTVNANGSFAYTPAAGFSGPDSFTYAPGDGDATGAPVTVRLTVASGQPSFELYLNAGGANYTAVDGTQFVADTPYAVGGRAYSKAGAIAGTQDDTLYQSERYGTFGYDIAVEDGTYSVVFEFAEIFFNEAGRRVFDVEIEDGVVLDNFDIFAASGGKNVAYSTNPIVVEVTDGTLDIDFLQGVQNPKVSAIRVTSFVALGEPPVATPDSYSVDEDTTLTVPAAGVLANDSDPDSATIVASLVSGTSNGILTLNSDGSFEYVPDADFAGTDSFTYSVSDGNGNTDQATATITVDPVNDAPTGADDAYVSPSNTTLSVNAAGGLLANDVDVEGSVLDVARVNGSMGNVGTAITLASGATLTVNADGSFEYTPAAGFSEADSFTYAPGDGSVIGAPVTVTIDVSGGAAPLVATNAGITLDEGGVATIGGGVLKTTDADTAAADLVYTLTAPPTAGTLSLDGVALGAGDTVTQSQIDAGLLGYAHNGSEAPQDSFGFSVTDGIYTIPGQSFTINVDPVNDAPVANADVLSVAYGATVNIDVLDNDTDADGDPLRIVSVEPATNGTVAINDAGTPGDRSDDYLTYTGSTAGLDTFSYTISDGNGGTATATVEVDVEPLEAIAFSKVSLTGIPNKSWTSLEFGPDGRLYASQRAGEIFAFDIDQVVDGNGKVTGYHASSSERIDIIKTIPNHDDDGTLNPTVTTRQITGILLDGTPENPVLYVSSSDPREGGGGGGGEGDLGLDTNSGVISRLTWNGTAWEKVDLVRGLPRSEENHSTNGLDMMVDPETGARTLLVAQGGNTNAGAPSKNFAYSSEYALSAAILEIDLDRIESGTGEFAVKTDGNGQSYVYDIPTVLGPVFGGMDGLNQARIVAGGPVQVYSSGYRNPYDVVVTEDGDVFTIDNGANKGWGGLPQGEGTAGVTDQIPTVDPDGFQNVNNLDHLEYIPGRGYYAGHPNPIRANPDGAGLTYTDASGNEVWVQSPSGAWPPVDPGILFPEDGDFRLPGVEDDALVTWSTSTNGIAEYTATNFQGALRGNLLAAGFDNAIYRIIVDPSNGSATKEVLAEGLSGVPLDVIAQGDTDPFAGTIWIAYIAGQAEIDVLVPTGLSGDPNDFDGDGYTNADELANGTNPNSPSSIPPDNDADLVSDLGDSDDDNDLLLDPADHFAIDAANGTDVVVSDAEGYFNPLRNDNPGTGFAGLGFKGWMSNGTTNYLDQYDDDNLIAGGTSGIFTISETTPGDARGGLNTQDNGFQYGVTLATTGPVIVKASMLNVFQPLTLAQLEQGQFAGIQIGTGDQDNYVKLAVAVNPSGALDLVALYEEDGVVREEIFALDTTVAIGSQVDLFLEIDRGTGEVTPGWTVDGGPGRIGQTIDVDGDVLAAILGAYQNGGQDSAMAVGVIASHGDTGTPLAAQYDYIDIFAGSLADQFDLIA